jgi:hypothetical protein
MRLTLKKCILICFEVSFLSHVLFGQSAPPATQSTMFHITGKITISNNFSAFAVTFKGESSKTVETNEAGVYKADLPLGLWTMTVQPYTPAGKTDITLYRRPPFRVDKPISLAFDISLPDSVGCANVKTPPAQSRKELEAFCAGEEFISVPSASIPFEVHVWGGSHAAACLVWAEDKVSCKREFATYNVLSVTADKVEYHPTESILEARGDVVIADESGEHRAHSVTFHLLDERAIRTQQDD